MISNLFDYNILCRNTFKLECTVKEWIEFNEKSDLPKVAEMIAGRKFRCIGAGSNMLFPDRYDGVLLHPAILNFETKRDATGNLLLKLGAGLEMDTVIERLAKAGIWGMENLSHIPGEVGAAAVQNVGAYGVEIKDFISEVECFDLKNREFVKLSVADCHYAYRDSIFKCEESRHRYIVTEVILSISANEGAKLGYANLHTLSERYSELTPNIVRDEIIMMRDRKLPKVDLIGSAGSFFKNPVISTAKFESLQTRYPAMPHYATPEGYKIPAAWLIEQCGLKEYRLGGAAVWRNQPLVIVNAEGNATYSDIITLEHHIIEKISQKFGITLHPEVDHIS